MSDAGTGHPTSGSSARATELAVRLAEVRGRLERAAAHAGRDPAELTLVVVTKTRPVADVAILAGLGVRDVGEAREDEASAKVADLADRPLRWHQVGQVQTKKAGRVARWADVVHSLDRDRLLAALARGAEAAQRTIDVFLQVSLDGDPERAGAVPQELPRLAEQVVRARHLRLLGVMAVAPRTGDPDAAFARLAEISARLQADHPDARYVSAGMSGDLEQAVAHGATHLRVGAAVLGSRPPLK